MTMWPFAKRPSKEALQGHKRVSVYGMRFVIRRINPFLDFPADKMPSIFADHVSRREFDPAKAGPLDIRRVREDLSRVIRAGVIDPPLTETGAEGITVDDLDRMPGLLNALYAEIIGHSLNMFRGLRGVFFSIRLKLWLSTLWRNDTAKSPPTSPSPVEASP
jgi:hypothetical protein